MKRYIKINIWNICGITLPTQEENISKFNQNMKSDKRTCIIYADLKSLIKKINNCKKNTKKYSTRKIVEYIPCRHSMSTTRAFYNIENKHSLYRGEDRMN